MKSRSDEHNSSLIFHSYFIFQFTINSHKTIKLSSIILIIANYIQFNANNEVIGKVRSTLRWWILGYW
jgi:hypothetical protein